MARQLPKLPITTLDASTYFIIWNILSINYIFDAYTATASALVGFEAIRCVQLIQPQELNLATASIALK